MWKNAARGRGEPPRSRSIANDAMPCCARNIAVERPTRPPPANKTGASFRVVTMSYLDIQICQFQPIPRPGRSIWVTALEAELSKKSDDASEGFVDGVV